MKQNMMIVGCNVKSTNEENPDLSIFELELQPLTTVKKVTAIEDIMSNGSFEGMIGAAMEYQQGQLRSSVYITLGEWRDKKYNIGSHVTFEMLPEKI